MKEGILNKVTDAVQFLIILARVLTVLLRWDDHFDARAHGLRNDRIGIITFIRKQIFSGKTVN